MLRKRCYIKKRTCYRCGKHLSQGKMTAGTVHSTDYTHTVFLCEECQPSSFNPTAPPKPEPVHGED